MRPVSEYTDLGGGLFFWQAYDRASRVDLYASAVAAGGKLYFVDPIPLAEEAIAELAEQGGMPAGIVVTNANHARAAEDFRVRFSVPVCIHPAAAAEVGMASDAMLDARGGPAFGGVFEAVPLPGAVAGEIALYLAERGGTVIVGDAVINLASHGFAVLPEKYCEDEKELRRSLAGLAERSFERMLFAHGEPILKGAREKLVEMLEG